MFKMFKKEYIIAFIISYILTLAIEFLIVSAIYGVVCWAFSLDFLWKIALVIFLFYEVIKHMIKLAKQ